ncbi:Gfo/Idh/MocA family oxidoreductase [bacterium]|nr:Gfo/Idh/MocA family oxidoreductase [bacterium]
MIDDNVLSVLLVGCGNIAGDLDSKRTEDGLPLTHAGAYTSNPHFKIVGCVDVDKEKSNQFAVQWDITHAYASVEEVLQANVQFDVISICTPTSCHTADLNACLSLSPKLIFCEKPVTDSVNKTIKIKAKCDQAGILLAVNYLRRWDERVVNLKAEIETNKRGSLRSVVGYYNKGILNNGSHLLDLLIFLVGDLIVKYVGAPNYDFFSFDPSVCVVLETSSSVPVILVPAANASDFSIFEIQIIFEKGTLTMLDGGLMWAERNVIDSDIFNGYKVLEPATIDQGGYAAGMLNAVDNIWRAISQGDSLDSTVDTALPTQILCEKIAKQYSLI